MAWKYKGGTFGALLTDLSKAFNCLAHELLMAKLNSYGFDMRLLISYTITCPIESKE